MSTGRRRGWSVFSLLTVVLLSACGGHGENGGGGLGSTASQPQVAEPAAGPLLRLESRVQPAAAAEKTLSPIEKRAAHTVLPDPARIALEPIELDKSSGVPVPGGMRQIGSARNLPRTASVAATGAQLQWQLRPGGGSAAALSFSADGAKGLRLGVWVNRLPGSAILRLYRPLEPATAFRISGQEVLQVLQRNTQAGDTGDAARTWWSPDLGGSQVTLEIELPPGTPPSSVEIAVPTLSHVFADLSLPPRDADQLQAIGDASTCNLDATCYGDYDSASDAVARMTFVKNGVSYQCTGALLNNRANDSTPYFISANHCLSDQTTASTLTTDWFFRAPSCGARTLGSARSSRYGGAQLLYTSSTTDTVFLLLNDAPPANARFAGWDASPPPLGAPVAGLHHSRGDLLKISFGSIQNYASCTEPNNQGSYSCTTSGTSAPFVRVRWDAGTTEGGSSGSPLFMGAGASRYVVGVLRGGNSSCVSSNGQDSYGRFDIAFGAALKNWLDPALTGPGPAGRLPLYRFYNAGTGAHFYTTSAVERDQVIAHYRDFAYEGTAFNAYAAPAAGQSPVFRFYNPQTRAHFYTASTAERDQVRSTLPAFQYEGTGWYGQIDSGNGAAPVFRFFRPGSGTHFYTISGDERNVVINNYRDFRYEGIAYYGWRVGN